MDSEEYIKIKDLDVEYKSDKEFGLDYDELLEKEGDSVYQFQPIKDSNRCTIMKVGKFVKIPSILCNEFDLNKKIRCLITSSLYSIIKLEENEKQCRFNMKRIIINDKSMNGKLSQIGCIMLNFNTFVHIQNKNNGTVLYYLSTKYHLNELDGFFSISFHYEDKVINLEIIKKYLGDIEMLEKMIYYLSSPNVYKIINDFVVNK